MRTLEAAAGPTNWRFLKFLIARYEPTDVPRSQLAGFPRLILLDQVLATPVLKSIAVSDAGLTQRAIYERDPGQMVRKTLDRITESLDGAADEFDYIERFYNPRRRHSKLGYLSPMAFEARAMQP